MGGVASAVGNAVGTAAKIGAGTLLGGPLGGTAAALGNIGSNPAPPSSMVNSVDPNLTAMKNQQVKAATDYNTNLAANRNQQYNAAADTSRQQLARSLASNTTGANSRGMLYGSNLQGAQAQTTAQNAADLNTAKTNINTNTQNTLNQLQDQALGTGMNINQTQQSQNDLAYQIALQRQQQDTGAFGSLLGGAGGLLGRAMG